MSEPHNFALDNHGERGLGSLCEHVSTYIYIYIGKRYRALRIELRTFLVPSFLVRY